MGCQGASSSLGLSFGVMGKKKKDKNLKHRPLPLQLRPYRERLEMTQAELGELLGHSDATIGRIENGKQNWNQEFLQEAARVLRCHWFELLPLERERARVKELLKLIAGEPSGESVHTPASEAL